MKVLVTGHLGYIGAELVPMLVNAGHDVVAVDAMLPAAHGEGAERPDGVEDIDVRDAAAVARLHHDGSPALLSTSFSRSP